MAVNRANHPLQLRKRWKPERLSPPKRGIVLQSVARWLGGGKTA
jgi:hypothetical protein